MFLYNFYIKIKVSIRKNYGNSILFISFHETLEKIFSKLYACKKMSSLYCINKIISCYDPRNNKFVSCILNLFFIEIEKLGAFEERKSTFTYIEPILKKSIGHFKNFRINSSDFILYPRTESKIF